MSFDNIYYVGVDDKRIDLFEGQYKVPEGMTYNSYVIIDEKCAVLDGVDADFTEEWLKKVGDVLKDRSPDYLVVHHMEPDHSAGIKEFTLRYPYTTIVSSSKAFMMMNNFFGSDFVKKHLVVTEGDVLNLGAHRLTFINAPMIHWPEVIMSYEEKTKTLFTADAFGRFGASDAKSPWKDEARRYYIGIVGKYGKMVSNLLKKAAALDISRICPLHGPILDSDLNFYLDLYQKWATYTPEERGVTIAYASVYGNTAKAAKLLKERLSELGCQAVKIFDLSRCDKAEAIASAFMTDSLVVASSTYNGDVFPPMHEFLRGLTERGFKGRKVGIIENGSWAPAVKKTVLEMLKDSEQIRYCENEVKILSAMSDQNREEIEALARELS